MRRFAVALNVLVVFALFTSGCGGGGSAVTPGPGPDPDPDPDPIPVAIGPGPGAAADIIPTELGISTTAARNAPLATAPDADNVRQAVTNEFDALMDNPPDSLAELQTLLTQFTGWANQDPDDPAAQFGLALMTAMAGLYNTGIDAGFIEADIFAMLPASLDKSATGSLTDLFLRPVQFAAALHLGGPQALMAPTKAAKSAIPGLEDEGISTQDLQIAIRNYLIPSLDSAIARLSAVANNAPAWDPLVAIGSGDNAVNVYPADFKLVTAILRVLKSFAHELVAYQLNAGSHDWGASLASLDANNDDILTVAEYAPADPFLWRHSAPNMQIAGVTLGTALNNAIWAVRNSNNSLVLGEFFGLTRQADVDQSVAELTDLRDLLTGPVDVQITYNNIQATAVAPAAVRTMRTNFGAIFSDPVYDIKNLLPTLHVVGSAAEVQGASDFPDLTFHGIILDPQPIRNIIAGDYNHVVISYGSLRDIELVSP